MSAVVSTTIEIAADPRAVWDVLIDFAAYGEWNPHGPHRGHPTGRQQAPSSPDGGERPRSDLQAEGACRDFRARAALAWPIRVGRPVRRRTLLRAERQRRRQHPAYPRGEVLRHLRRRDERHPPKYRRRLRGVQHRAQGAGRGRPQSGCITASTSNTIWPAAITTGGTQCLHTSSY